MQILKSILAATAIFTAVVSAKPLEKREIPSEVDVKKILHSHNKYRAQHDAGPLSWDEDLAKAANDWSEQCQFAHSPDGKHGENMAFNQGSKDWESMIDLWYNEVSKYNFDSPGFNSETGHFTQVVWKNTSSIGCGATYCPNLGFNVYVCEYEPRGNIIGFGDNPGQFFSNNVVKSKN